MMVMMMIVTYDERGCSAIHQLPRNSANNYTRTGHNDEPNIPNVGQEAYYLHRVRTCRWHHHGTTVTEQAALFSGRCRICGSPSAAERSRVPSPNGCAPCLLPRTWTPGSAAYAAQLRQNPWRKRPSCTTQSAVFIPTPQTLY